MPRFSVNLILLVITPYIVLLGYVLPLYSQPEISKDNIPTGIDQQLRKHIEELYNKDSEKRAQAAYAIGKMGDGAYQAIPFLVGMLYEWDIKREIWEASQVEKSPGREAGEALRKIGKKSVPSLVELIKNQNKSEFVRTAAARILGQLNDTRAVDALISVMADNFWDAPWVIGIYDSDRDLDPLLSLLDDAHSSILQTTVLQSLILLTGKNFSYDKEAWEYWWIHNRGPIKIDIVDKKDSAENLSKNIILGVPAQVTFTLENTTDDYIIIRNVNFEEHLPDIYNWYGSVKGALGFDGLHDSFTYNKKGPGVTDSVFVRGLLFPHEKIEMTRWLVLKDNLLQVDISYNRLTEYDITKHVYFNTKAKGSFYDFEHVPNVHDYKELLKSVFAVIPRLHIIPDLEIFPFSEQSISMDIRVNKLQFDIKEAFRGVDIDVIDFVFWETERGWVLKGIDKTYLVRKNGRIELPDMDLDAFVIIAEQFVEIDVILPLKGYEEFSPKMLFIYNEGNFNTGITTIRADKLLGLFQQAKKNKDKVTVKSLSTNGEDKRYFIVIGGH